MAADIAQVIAGLDEINSPRAFYKQLVDWINKFDENLGNDHEVGMKYISFSQTYEFHLSQIHYCHPSLIIFKGTTLENEDVELIQHVNQVSILLVKMQLRDSNKPKLKNRFGPQPNQSPNS